MTIIDLVVLHRDFFQNITVHSIHLLLQVHTSYIKIKPQSKHILRDTHMSIIYERQNEGDKGVKSFEGRYQEDEDN